MTVQYQIIYWRDIPVHLRVRRGRNRLSYPLPEIFEKTVYRAAYRAKAITGDAYQESWRPEGWFDYEAARDEEREAELEVLGRAIAAELSAAYDEARLDALALNEGRDPAHDAAHNAAQDPQD